MVMGSELLSGISVNNQRQNEKKIVIGKKLFIKGLRHLLRKALYHRILAPKTAEKYCFWIFYEVRVNDYCGEG